MVALLTLALVLFVSSAVLAHNCQSRKKSTSSSLTLLCYRVRAARKGINPLTKKEFSTPETKVVRFSMAKGEDNFWGELAKAKLFSGKAKAPAAAPAKKAGKKDK